MDTMPPITSSHSTGRTLAVGIRAKICITASLLAISAVALSAPRPPSNFFGGVLHARGPHGVYTEIRFEPHRLVAQVHEPHMCVLHAHLVHGDPHASRYAIEPPQGGRFCDELVDGEIVIRPHSPNEVSAEFRSMRMDWSGEFRRRPPGH
ncbi:hypothetical protein [Dyella acidiphila]|uniref:Uncharacterized protein n=1 Tax=Dyella acidiphila TaxID=2775866 RepID=A0ABR9GET9_9GAMM|nr:hypothetical protein [Dyella acidiphila]MBE1162547.1 hypothetical protein [Dyella acidiphila]